MSGQKIKYQQKDIITRIIEVIYENFGILIL